MSAPAELELVVAGRDDAVGRVAVIRLARADGGPLPAWEPGGHIDLMLPGGVERQYSLCGEPADASTWTIGVLREPGGRGGSEWIHEHLVPGESVRARGPRSHFSLAPAPSYRFIAGGIGITALLPMIRVAQAAGADWRLDYAGRSRAELAFLPELERWGDRVVVHAADEGGRADLPALLGAPGEDALVYCCGPGRMLDEVEALCAAWPEGSLRTERFQAVPLASPVRQGVFEVELASSGMTLQVPEDRSILDVVEEAGVFALSSCREGTCGTCETPLLEGEADHRDAVLSPAEREMNDRIMICVSRAACPRLQLEL